MEGRGEEGMGKEKFAIIFEIAFSILNIREIYMREHSLFGSDFLTRRESFPRQKFSIIVFLLY